MKTKILLTILLIGLVTGIYAQKPIMTLTFTAVDSSQYVPLDSIHIENLTQGCDTNLYAPETVLFLNYITGIGYMPNTADDRFSVSQNYPNPFTYSTKVDLYISDDQDVNIYVRDLIGRELSRLTLSLQKGAHSLTIYPGNENIYLLTISGVRESQTIKMLNAGSGSAQSSQCKIVYNPGHKTEYGLKAVKSINGFTFSLDDLLRYTGYAIMLNSNPGSDTLEDAPLTDTLYTFNIHEASTVVLPTVTTDSVTNITQTTATSGGNVLSDGGADVTLRGVCWSTSPDPTTSDPHTVDGSGPGTFVSNITGLTHSTFYYVRAYATNSIGTAYGNEVTFTTTTPFYCGDQIADIDGNLYNTVEIGIQCWMKENLKTTKYNNNTPIPNVTAPTAWLNLTSGAYAWYNNDSTWKDKYGALYNWYTTVDANKLCPTGWHVPTQAEWTDLIDYIGGTASPHGNELKSCRQVGSPLGGGCNTNEHPRWNYDDTHYGTDDYGFRGLPGGFRNQFTGGFEKIGIDGRWLSSTGYASGSAFHLWLRNSIGHVNMNPALKTGGGSVRCLKD